MTERPTVPPGRLNIPREQIRVCLQHTEDRARQAAAQTCPKLKEDFLDMERRWLFLARSYELTERITDFSAETNRRAKDHHSITG